MKVVAFDPALDLIFVKTRVWSADRTAWKDLDLVLDTGSPDTLILPKHLESIGYKPAEAEIVTTVSSAVGKERGHRLPVSQFAAFGYSTTDFVIHAFQLPAHMRVEGLLGLSFLRQFNYEIRSSEGRILVEPLAA